ncbi:hypothetical protein D1227_01700 [Henriciella mobilis]|uniref:hypothetical protein n=1 Tax=Henriciella mobilis TaxID=2305467 RepID=UPI000E66FB41|nr:hypothetical protein [Henriciella mobilis]RIJ18096.1 hypothetical protein D1231_01955 [Henriciella mobilis]RIJ25096.1 hypothetical protein D1227_01700 [Henriciella mobilis]
MNESTGAQKKTRRGLMFGIPLTLILGGGLSFFANVLSVQDSVCSLGFAQPGIADLCGAIGAGGKPTKRERLAWDALDTNSCEALRQHIQSFPGGVFRDDAADLLQASRTIETERWEPVERRLAIFVDGGPDPSGDVASAKNAAQEKATRKAGQMCRSFASTASYKLDSASADVTEWMCAEQGGGQVCSLEGEAVCSLQLRGIVETETCGSSS